MSLAKELKLAGINPSSLLDIVPSFLKPDPTKGLDEKELEKLEKMLKLEGNAVNFIDEVFKSFGGKEKENEFIMEIYDPAIKRLCAKMEEISKKKKGKKKDNGFLEKIDNQLNKVLKGKLSLVPLFQDKSFYLPVDQRNSCWETPICKT